MCHHIIVSKWNMFPNLIFTPFKDFKNKVYKDRSTNIIIFFSSQEKMILANILPMHCSLHHKFVYCIKMCNNQVARVSHYQSHQWCEHYNPLSIRKKSLMNYNNIHIKSLMNYNNIHIIMCWENKMFLFL
jgi:hypothetical protein